MKDDVAWATVSLLVLLTIVALRARTSFRRPDGRLTMMATLSGVAAFICVGVVVPLEVIDGGLGGTNFVNYLQNAFATTAFWLLMQGVLTLEDRDRKVQYRTLPLLLGAFLIPFLMIPDRGPTNENFIKDYAHEPMLWAYASIYMAGVALMMLRVSSAIRGRTPLQYIPIRVGALAIAAGSVIEIIYLTLRLVDAQPYEAVEFTGWLFVPLFYGGVVLAAAGMSVFPFIRSGRRMLLRFLRRQLSAVHAARGVDTRALNWSAPAYDTYLLAVRLNDISQNETLTFRERALLWVATRMLDWQMRAPDVLQLTYSPAVPAGAAAGR